MGVREFHPCRPFGALLSLCIVFEQRLLLLFDRSQNPENEVKKYAAFQGNLFRLRRWKCKNREIDKMKITAD
jgi:hypothetical protein